MGRHWVYIGYIYIYIYTRYIYTRARARKNILKRQEMAEPDRPPGLRSLYDFGVRRVAEKRRRRWIGPEVERDVEAKGQARAVGRWYNMV